MLSFYIKFVQTHRQTDGQTTVELYAPDLRCRRIKRAYSCQKYIDAYLPPLSGYYL